MRMRKRKRERKGKREREKAERSARDVTPTTRVVECRVYWDLICTPSSMKYPFPLQQIHLKPPIDTPASCKAKHL